MDIGRLYDNIVRKLPPPRPEDQLEVHRPLTGQLYRPIRRQLHDRLGDQLRGHDGEGLL